MTARMSPAQAWAARVVVEEARELREYVRWAQRDLPLDCVVKGARLALALDLYDRATERNRRRKKAGRR